jgi:DNA-binding transcriptional regulator LsrR (DeoR family)
MEEIASLYHEDHLTQDEISKRLFISRSQISRLLQRAEECGIVEVRVNHTIERSYELENKLKMRYGLKQAFLVNCRRQQEKNVKQRAAMLAGQYLQKHIKKDTTLGVSWGSTVSETVNALAPEKSAHINIVQIMGASPASSLSEGSISFDMTQKLVEKYSATVYNLSTPLYIEDEYVRKVIVNDMYIVKTLNMGVHSDIILTGIGSPDSIKSTRNWQGYMNDGMLSEIRSKGGVGCLCARFYDTSGNPIDCRWNRNLIGIQLPLLRRVPEVIAVATGGDKTEAIGGALRGGYIDVLVSDSDAVIPLL